MSWVLVVALLVIFVVRTGYSMVNRQRLRAQTGMTSPAQTVVNPAQRSGTEPAHAAASVKLWQPDDTASDDTEVPTTLALSAGLEAKVRELMDGGFEAGAVRLICDELGVGILAAQQTARTVAGLATP